MGIAGEFFSFSITQKICQIIFLSVSKSYYSKIGEIYKSVLYIWTNRIDYRKRGKMGPLIAKQIDLRMKAQNISISTLEKKAGGWPHAVRNILTGKSKSPSAVNLQAIADALGCTVKDLLETPEALQEHSCCELLDEILKKKHDAKTELMPETARVIHDLLQKSNKDITVEQFLIYIRELYLHSLQKNPNKVDLKFAEWFKDLMR